MAMAQSSPGESGGSNHPHALRMGIIAFLCQNVTIGCMWGSFSVLLAAAEARLAVKGEMIALAVPLVSVVGAGLAPIVGVLVTRYSLRLLMIAGALLGVAAFVLLASSRNLPAFLLAYAMLGVAMSFVGMILPATLVTRWFKVNRGKALGLVHMSIVVALLPLPVTWLLGTRGLTTAYLALAALSAIPFLAALFIVDRPPGEDATAAASAAQGPSAAGGMGVLQLLRTPQFWLISVAAAILVTGSIDLTAHMVPLTGSWGMAPTLAATLLTAQSLFGIAGTPLFGWVSDRVGGRRSLAILAFNGAVLWSLLLLHPPYPLAFIIIGLIGLHGAGMIPSFAMSLSQTFGRDNFSRAYGLGNLLNLPFMTVSVPGIAMIYTRTGSYDAAIMTQAGVFVVALLLALASVRRSAAVT